MAVVAREDLDVILLDAPGLVLRGVVAPGEGGISGVGRLSGIAELFPIVAGERRLQLVTPIPVRQR